MAAKSVTRSQQLVRRYGASLGLIALALLLSRYVTPSGASSPLVLLGATAAVAYFGGMWPAILATVTAAGVNAAAIGIADWPRLAVESSMILLLGTTLAFRVPRAKVAEETPSPSIRGEAFVNPRPDPVVITADGPNSAGTQNRAVIDTAGANAPSVLVVHGNAVLRLALRSTLAGLGYRVRDAAGLTQAAPILDAGALKAVIYDAGRIDDAALAAIEGLRTAANDGLLVVLANAQTDDERELALAAGADLFLQKPVDTAAVATKLRERLPLTDDGAHSRVGLGASP